MIQQHNSQLISTKTAEHYTWEDHCDGWFFLKDAGVHVILERMPPGAAEVMHYHRKSKQLFYVLRGELTMRKPSVSIAIPAGHAIAIDPLEEHQARNDSLEPVEFLVTSCPPSRGDRFERE